MNERTAPSKTGGRIGAVERCGRGAGAGTRAGAQQPSFSLSLVACSLSLRAFWCWWWDLLSSLCCRIHFCSEYHILSQALEDSSAQTNNSLFITPFIGRDFVLLPFIPPPHFFSPSILPQELGAANRASTFSFLSSSPSSALLTLYSLNFLIGFDFLFFLFLDSS
jgi:hypothetical protein